jgi:hypothetical protein
MPNVSNTSRVNLTRLCQISSAVRSAIISFLKLPTEISSESSVASFGRGSRLLSSGVFDRMWELRLNSTRGWLPFNPTHGGPGPDEEGAVLHRSLTGTCGHGFSSSCPLNDISDKPTSGRRRGRLSSVT